MKNRFTLFRRSSIFYCEDAVTGQQTSLRTKNEEEARTLLHADHVTWARPLLQH
jgi:hypothetical protein